MKFKGKEFFLITGLARSGTTYLSNLLNTHPDCYCVSDPINVFFKAYFCELQFRLTGTWLDIRTISMPSGFMDNGLTDILKVVDLKQNINSAHYETYRDAIADNSENFTPEIAHEIRQINTCRTFKDFFEALLECVYNQAGQDQQTIGIKTAWTEAIVPVLQNTYSDMKVVHIIRDPRAVVASNYKTGDKRYPLLYNIRDWRKSVYYYFYLRNRLHANYYMLRYEDLINKRQQVLQQVFVFLQVDSNVKTEDVQNTNSSYEKEVKSNEDYLFRWKETLPYEIVSYVNATCQWEMQKLGYSYDGKVVDHIKEDAGYIDFKSLSEWCREDFQNEDNVYRSWLEVQNKLENIRNYMAATRSNFYENIAPALFFDRPYYDWLRLRTHLQN